MKRLLISLAVLIGISVAAAAENFAIVDKKALMESMPEYQDVRARIADISKRYHEEYTRMSEDIDRKFQDYQLLQNDGSPSTIRERRIQEIQNLQKRAQQFLETAEADLIRQEKELMEPVEKKIERTLREIGVEENFVFIFPADAPLFSGIEVVDITERAISRLRQMD